MAAKKKAAPAMQFVLDYLKKKPKAEYAEVRDAAAKKRYKIFPIMYGRAKSLLGLVPTAPRGQGKAAQAKKRKAARSASVLVPARRGPGRPRKAKTPALDSLESIITAMKDSESERERYRRALHQIGEILQGAL